MISCDSIPTLMDLKKYGINTDDRIKERLESAYPLGIKGLNNEEIICTFPKDVKNQLLLVEKMYSFLNCKGGSLKENILLEGYYSATIEGAETTVESVKKCFSNPKSKSDKMVVNAYRAIGYMRDKDITEETILHAWRILVSGVCENKKVQGLKYRNGMVYVGNSARIIHTPAKPEDINKLMLCLIELIQNAVGEGFCKCFVKAVAIHFYMVYIHPMCDGNGRLARLIMISYLNKMGFNKVLNLSVSRSIDENRSGYYFSLVESEKVLNLGNKIVLDITPFLVYMLNVFERSIFMYDSFSKNTLTKVESTVIGKMKRKGVNAEITVSKCSKMLNVSDSTSRSILNSLSQKGLLQKYKVGRKNIYRLV